MRQFVPILPKIDRDLDNLACRVTGGIGHQLDKDGAMRSLLAGLGPSPTMMDKAMIARCKGALFHLRQKPEAYNAPDFGECLRLL
jgi:hypothetical protein